jgi:hypothetical protein
MKPSAQRSFASRIAGSKVSPATAVMIGAERWANAVASAGTRAISPPRTRIWATPMFEGAVAIVSTIDWATSRSTWFMNRTREDGM